MRYKPPSARDMAAISESNSETLEKVVQDVCAQIHARAMKGYRELVMNSAPEWTIQEALYKVFIEEGYTIGRGVSGNQSFFSIRW